MNVNSTLSILTLIIGIYSILITLLSGALFGLIGVIGIIVGAKARSKPHNKKMVNWGMSLSIVPVAIFGLMLILSLVRLLAGF